MDVRSTKDPRRSSHTHKPVVDGTGVREPVLTDRHIETAHKIAAEKAARVAYEHTIPPCPRCNSDNTKDNSCHSYRLPCDRDISRIHNPTPQQIRRAGVGRWKADQLVAQKPLNSVLPTDRLADMRNVLNFRIQLKLQFNHNNGIWVKTVCFFIFTRVGLQY